MQSNSTTTQPDWMTQDELDALAAAPEHHKLLFENERVRVLETRIPPGERTAVHTHRWPGILYMLSWTAIVRRDDKGTVIYDSRVTGDQRELGAAYWSPVLPPHTLENVGTVDLHLINVELKEQSS
jgi:mannose-6-phosphate isomerase-like protein (cupin superfamily)